MKTPIKDKDTFWIRIYRSIVIAELRLRKALQPTEDSVRDDETCLEAIQELKTSLENCNSDYVSKLQDQIVENSK